MKLYKEVQYSYTFKIYLELWSLQNEKYEISTVRMKSRLLKVWNLFFESSEIERIPRTKPIILQHLCLYLLLIILFLCFTRVLKSFGWLFLPFGLINFVHGFEKYFNKENKWDVLFSFGGAIACILYFLL